MLTSKFNILKYIQNAIQKATRFNKTHNCFWQIFMRVQGEEINKLAFEIIQVSSRTTTGNNRHKNFPWFPKMHLTHKGKKTTTKHSTTAKNSISGKLSKILLSIPLSWNMLLGEGAAVLALLDLKINRNKSIFWTTLSSTSHKSNCHIPYNCHGHIEECSFLLGAFKNVLKLNLSDISESSFTLILVQKLYQTSL